MPGLNRRDFAAAAAGAALAAGCSGSEDPARRPNLLLLLPDQYRPDWTGFNAAVPVRTPVLDALAARGVRFDRAVCASPLCAPSRACLAAGREYDRCGVPGNGVDYPLDQPTFYQSLRAAGYHTLGCGKFDLHKATEVWGLDGQRLLPEWGFSGGIDNAGKWDAIRSGSVEPQDPYMGHLHATGRVKTHVDDFEIRRGAAAFTNTAPTPLADESYCDNWIGAQAVRLLREAPADKPWLLQVNFTGPHDPLDITESMASLYPDVDGFPAPIRNDQYPPELHLAMRRNYSAMVENIDRRCGEILAEVERRGELDNTLVVFSSDHGEMLGDHNRWRKRVPYQASAGVPFVVAGPGVEARGSSRALVSLMDLAATFLDYGDGEALPEMDGLSLRALLEGRTVTHREFVRSGLEPWRLVIEGKWKLVQGFDTSLEGYYSRRETPAFADMQDGPALLFDLDENPEETVNLAGKAPEVVRRLEPLLRPA